MIVGQGSLAWLPNDRYGATARYELRDQEGLGADSFRWQCGKITEDIAVLGQLQHSYVAFTGNTKSCAPSYLNSWNFIRQPRIETADVYEVIRMTNASISFFSNTRSLLPIAVWKKKWAEDVSFTFQEIEIENNPGHTSAVDSWESVRERKLVLCGLYELQAASTYGLIGQSVP